MTNALNGLIKFDNLSNQCRANPINFSKRFWSRQFFCLARIDDTTLVEHHPTGAHAEHSKLKGPSARRLMGI
jgi:hypothetical protein